MALLGRVAGFLDKYLFGYALGTAAGPALTPYVQPLANEAWLSNPVRPVDAEVAAAIVAEDVEQLPWGQNQAQMTGIGAAAFEAMYGEALNAPGVGELFALWRRDLIGAGEFVHGLRKAKLEGRWDGPLQGLRDTLLSSEELAMAQQQGFVSEARADSEGGLQGVTQERQQIRFEMAGLPPGPETALDMLRRGIIGEAEFAQIIREGHTKTKYTDEYLALIHPVLSASEYATLFLKGWITQPERDAGGALTGYTPEQMQNLYLAMGRPAAPGQMSTAVARGINGPDGTPMNEAQFLKGIRESDIRPEWGPMLWGIRFAYPPLFQINRLVQSGAITAAVALDWAKKDRYAPEVLTALGEFWGAAGATTSKALTKAELADEFEAGYITEADYRAQLTKLGYTGTNLDLEVHLSDARRLKRWREKVVDAIAKAFIEHDIDAAAAAVDLAGIGVTGEAATRLIALWQLEQRVARKHLTAAQVKRAYRRNIITQADALAALANLNYTPTDAATYLAE